MTNLQRQQVDTFLEKTGVKSDAVFAVARLDELLAEDGTVDAEKISAAIKTAQAKLGVNPIGKGHHIPALGHHPDASKLKPADDFAAAFAPKGRKR